MKENKNCLLENYQMKKNELEGKEYVINQN
jgi:hypothetical protein